MNQPALWAIALALSGAFTTLALLFSGGIKKTSTKIFSAIFSIPPLLLALVSLQWFDVEGYFDNEAIQIWIIQICIFTLIITAIPLSFLRPTKAQLRDLLGGFVGMVLLFGLAFFMWLSGAIELYPAKAYALAAMTAVAIALCVYLRRNRRNQSDDAV